MDKVTQAVDKISAIGETKPAPQKRALTMEERRSGSKPGSRKKDYRRCSGTFIRFVRAARTGYRQVPDI